jgi:NTE family protein
MLDKIRDWPSSRTAALVLAGGAAIGAYEAGAYAALHEAGGGHLPTWIASSSIGTINAAIIAGNEPSRRVRKLREFWEATAIDPLPISSFWLGLPTSGPRRVAYNRAGVVETLLFGRPAMFRPRLAPGPHAGPDDVSALYDLDPLRQTLARLVDFDILNSGAVRLSITATDLLTGERVVFDTTEQHIGPDHILASGAILPVFAPIEVDGRLLADGGFAANTPIDSILDQAGNDEITCFVTELFAPEGSRPQSLVAAINRAGDLAFGNQTQRILEGRQREHHLRQMISRLADALPPEICANPEIAAILAEGRRDERRVVFLTYRGAPDEVGPGKLFDFSRATLSDRWRAGSSAMRQALLELDESPRLS